MAVRMKKLFILALSLICSLSFGQITQKRIPSLGLTGFGVLQSSAGAPSSGGTGYVAGDVITLATTGGTCSSAPTVSVTTVSSGVITNYFIQQTGICTAIPPNVITQASTTGTGT